MRVLRLTPEPATTGYAVVEEEWRLWSRWGSSPRRRNALTHASADLPGASDARERAQPDASAVEELAAMRGRRCRWGMHAV